MTAARKNSPLTGRNLKQNQALGGRPSALIGWVERVRRSEGERETQRSIITTIITIAIIRIEI